ncbi:MAG: thymidine phosphorylase family protein [candidate division KSB1 bacterium]|nr:thymidine phosphorylase family protein [candidate division KSB1 bacterium]
MFKLRRVGVDTLSEHVVFIHERAVMEGNLGFRPLDRVRVWGQDPNGHETHEIIGVLNFCTNQLVKADEIGLSEIAFRDLGLPEGCSVAATHAPAPKSVDLVRSKLWGNSLDEAAFTEILSDVVKHRYSKVELSMFVLACALRPMALDELVALTKSMIQTGTTLHFPHAPIADKHCIGGIPGNRTTMIVVPILAALGLTVPKTSSRAITSPAGTADTMAVLANVAFTPQELYRIIEQAGACIAWGGALGLAPADDILITVERPMEIDTEAQMVASILSKKKTAGATHALLDIPVGNSAKVRSLDHAQRLAALFQAVARSIDLHLEVAITDAQGPIGWGIGPRLEALDVLAVLQRSPGAPVDLREKSLYLAARILELTGRVPGGYGYRSAVEALDSGRAWNAFQKIIEAQGPKALPPEAPFRAEFPSPADGRIRAIHCWHMARVAKHAGAPAHVSAGVRLLRTIGDVVRRGEPLFEIHAQSEAQLSFALDYARSQGNLVSFGF